MLEPACIHVSIVKALLSIAPVVHCISVFQWNVRIAPQCPGRRDQCAGQKQKQLLGSVSYDLTSREGAVYTNQLMSFSAVAGPVSLALQQTNTFRDKLGKYLWALVTMGSLPVQVH